MKKVIIIGAGGHAKEIIKLADDCKYNVIGLLEDSTALQHQLISGVRVLGEISAWDKYADHEFIIANGSPRSRYLVYKKMLSLGSPKFATLIHPSVIISDTKSVGEGTVICARCTVNVEVSIGEHCILNVNSTVAHESILEDFVTIAPMAAISGNVHLKKFVEVGTGASIRQGLTIEEGAMLGMGGVLTKDIPQNNIFVGNPANPFEILPAVETVD